MTNKTFTKSLEQMREKLAELAAAIPSRSGKQARQAAKDRASWLINDHKKKLEAAFDLACDKAILERLPEADRCAWQEWLVAAARLHSHIASTAGKSTEMIRDTTISFRKWLTGYTYFGYDKAKDALEPFLALVPNYQKKRGELFEQLAALDQLLKDLKVAVDASHKDRKPPIFISEATTLVEDLLSDFLPALEEPAPAAGLLEEGPVIDVG